MKRANIHYIIIVYSSVTSYYQQINGLINNMFYNFYLIMLNNAKIRAIAQFWCVSYKNDEFYGYSMFEYMTQYSLFLLIIKKIINLKFRYCMAYQC